MKKINSVKIIIMVTVFLGIWMANANASESLKIVTCEIPPFGFFTQDKKSAGIIYEIANRLGKETGFSFTNKIVPFSRMIGELENGKSDFGIFLVSKKNEKIALNVAPIFPMDNIVIGLKGAVFDSLESLHGKKVATVRGAKYDESFTSDNAIKKYETRDYQQSIVMLVNGRVNAMIGPGMGLFFTAKQMGYSKETFGSPMILNTKDACLQYSRKTADNKKIEALKAAVEKLRQNNTIQNIIDKYLK